jgi:hypothetical protein
VTVSAAVIAEELARARDMSASIVGTPARSIGGKKPIRQASARAKVAAKSNRETPARARVVTDPKTDTPARAIPATDPKVVPPARSDLRTIRLLGRTLDDLEKLRIQNQLRIGAAQRDGIDAPWAEQIDGGMRAVEHAAELELKRAWRRFDHPGRCVGEGDPRRRRSSYGAVVRRDRRPGRAAEPREAPRVLRPRRPGTCWEGAEEPTQEELFKRGNPNAKKAVWKLSYQFMRTVGSPGEAT